MKMNQIPTCYFPSTVLFVDDSRDFLLNFTLQLEEGIAFKICNSPFDALNTIHKAHQLHQINQQVLSEYLDSEECPITNYTINLNLASIHWEVYNPQRFSEISVVVVDYAMPGMNGLEFCSKMENSPIKRILLTGKADEKTAIQAFNDGIIDMYIQKQNPNIIELINKSIRNMQYRYFQNMSDIVIKMLSVRSPNCLQSSQFIEIFENISKKNNIVEHYLTENTGSFLMLTADADLSYLIVKSETDLKLHYEMAVDNNAPKAILDAIETGKKIPFFWKADDYFSTEWNDWSTYLYPATKIEDKEIYYYSYIKDPLSTDIKKDKILAFNQFLDQQDS